MLIRTIINLIRLNRNFSKFRITQPCFSKAELFLSLKYFFKRRENLLIRRRQRCQTLSPFTTCSDRAFKCGSRPVFRNGFLMINRLHLSKILTKLQQHSLFCLVTTERIFLNIFEHQWSKKESKLLTTPRLIPL
jgi:hypothetical protein